jgi:uncharacterized protein YggE
MNKNNKYPLEENSTISVVGEASGIIESESYSVFFTVSNDAEDKEDAEKANKVYVKKVAEYLINAGFRNLLVEKTEFSCDKKENIVNNIANTKMCIYDLEDFTLIDEIKTLLGYPFIIDKFIEYSSRESLILEKFDELVILADEDSIKKAKKKLYGSQFKLKEIINSYYNVYINNNNPTKANSSSIKNENFLKISEARITVTVNTTYNLIK